MPGFVPSCRTYDLDKILDVEAKSRLTPTDYKKLVKRLTASKNPIPAIIDVRVDGTVRCIGVGYITTVNNVVRFALENENIVITGTVTVISGKMVVEVLQVR